mmetsp:Transcript_20178/g.30005  ORF Transcript_20178/g.30005 Transcript_20178/m.30005 type:complete len:235 (-) Transcript_20178:55-759(-)
MGDGAYSFSLTTFSPSGKLVQIEYALQAIGKCPTSLGIKAKNGVVIATEKKLPPLMDEKSLEKVSSITRSIGVVYSGIGPDARVLVRKSRKAAQQYVRYFKEEAPVAALVRDVAGIMQDYTQSGGVRPFGVSLLVAGVDENGPALYQVDPSGSYFGWKASAIGKNMINARTFLEKRYNEDIELEDAIHTALLTLKEGFDGEMNEKNIEVGVVDDKTKKFRILTQSEVRDYLLEF